MKGYKNYRVTLEHVTDQNIDTFDTVFCTTEKEARKAATKMSKSKKFNWLKNQKNNYGELPNDVRVWIYSDEDSNDDFVQGTHTMLFRNGRCEKSTIG